MSETKQSFCVTCCRSTMFCICDIECDECGVPYEFCSCECYECGENTVHCKCPPCVTCGYYPIECECMCESELASDDNDFCYESDQDELASDDNDSCCESVPQQPTFVRAMCRYEKTATGCTNNRCTFLHESGAPKCRFNLTCTNPTCTWRHSLNH